MPRLSGCEPRRVGIPPHFDHAFRDVDAHGAVRDVHFELRADNGDYVRSSRHREPPARRLVRNRQASDPFLDGRPVLTVPGQGRLFF